MKKPNLLWMLPVAALASMSGCNTTPLTTTLQPEATQFALTRGRFDLNCPTATAQVLTSEVIQPPARALMINQGPERAQYTIGITGCDKRETLQVLCAQGGTGCFVAQ